MVCHDDAIVRTVAQVVSGITNSDELIFEVVVRTWSLRFEKLCVIQNRIECREVQVVIQSVNRFRFFFAAYVDVKKTPSKSKSVSRKYQD